MIVTKTATIETDATSMIRQNKNEKKPFTKSSREKTKLFDSPRNERVLVPGVGAQLDGAAHLAEGGLAQRGRGHRGGLR